MSYPSPGPPKYIVHTFIANGFKGVGLKSLNFVCTFIQAVFFNNITTVDRHPLSRQVFEGIASNDLLRDIHWQKFLPSYQPSSLLF